MLGSLIGRLARVRTTSARPAEATTPPDAATVQRRSFLRLTVLVGAGAVVAATAGRMLVSAAAMINEARGRIRLPAPATAPKPIPAGVNFSVPGLSPYVTPNGDFYRIDTALQVPVVDPAPGR